MKAVGCRANIARQEISLYKSLKVWNLYSDRLSRTEIASLRLDIMPTNLSAQPFLAFLLWNIFGQRLLAVCTWSTKNFTLSTGVSGMMPCPKLKMWPFRPSTSLRI